jgi:hypothetical protein
MTPLDFLTDALGIVHRNLLKQSNVIGRVARGDTTGQFLAITHA